MAYKYNKWRGIGWVLVLAGALLSSGCPSSEEGEHILSGKVKYQDKVYGSDGFASAEEPYKPVRRAVVDLLNDSDAIVATTETDNQGNYRFNDLGGGDYQVRVLAEAADADLDLAVSTTDNEVYAVVTSEVSVDGEQTKDISISIASTAAGAFNIYEVLLTGTEFVEAVNGGAFVFPALKGFWDNGEPGCFDGQYDCGTYTCNGFDSNYCPAGAGIYLLGGDVDDGDDTDEFDDDTDEFDDDVIWHEFGHYLEDALDITDSPGDKHGLTWNDLDLRLAWSEGWGDALPGLIKPWLEENHPERLSTATDLSGTEYIDTVGADMAGIFIDVASPGTCVDSHGDSVDCFIYSTNEIAVAKVLLKFAELEGRARLWEVLSGDMPVSEHLSTMETFWDGWSAHPSNATSEQQEAYQQVLTDRRIVYAEDAYEPDDGASDADARGAVDCTADGVCVEEEHHLYGGAGMADSDWVAIEVAAGKSYTFTADRLKNAADPYIRVYDAGENLLAENDDSEDVESHCCTNDGTKLSSQVTYTPDADGILYVEVLPAYGFLTDAERSAYFAGRYGSYTLTVEALAQ